jgi:putative peptidoglycan lipid II flippase
MAAVRHRFAGALRLVLSVVIGAAAVYVALSRPCVVAPLPRGAFTASDAPLVADTLVGFAVGIPLFSTYLFALRVYYSLEDTRTPFLINCGENAINVLLALWLFDELGIDGLAFAFSGAYAIAAVLTLALLSRRIGGLQGRGIGSTVVRVGVVAAVAGVAAWRVALLVGWDGPGVAIVSVLLGLLAAGAVTVGGLWLLRVEEFREVLALVRRRRADAPSPAPLGGEDPSVEQ